ncbi:MAG: rhodanese-like domain-containing protein [Microcoleaceae cyanobacterium]
MAIFNLIPNPEPMQEKSRAFDLKTRLDWGEPALTIIDARDLAAFNACHIQGAISIPVETLTDRAPLNLEKDRDIYLYAETDEQAHVAANKLREIGYTKVAELTGGVEAWKAVGYPVEAISAIV